MLKSMKNRQSAAKSSKMGKGSTTIPSGSTGKNTGKQPIYLRVKNVIYKIINTKTKKFYIGSASYYDKRIGTHISLLRVNNHKNPHLQSAWNKYGEEKFKFKIIEYVDKQENLLSREQYWLDFTKCYDREIGYNCSKIAGSNLGMKQSESAKKKIGDYWRGKPKSKEHVQKYIEVQTKLSGKPILVYDKKDNLLFEFKSISECSRELGITIAAISKQCSRILTGRFKNRRGKNYTFKYKDIV